MSAICCIAVSWQHLHTYSLQRHFVKLNNLKAKRFNIITCQRLAKVCRSLSFREANKSSANLYPEREAIIEQQTINYKKYKSHCHQMQTVLCPTIKSKWSSVFLNLVHSHSSDRINAIHSFYFRQLSQLNTENELNAEI